MVASVEVIRWKMPGTSYEDCLWERKDVRALFSPFASLTSELPYRVPTSKACPYGVSKQVKVTGRARTFRTSLTHRHTNLFGFGRRKIHSSERRKPSEVLMRLRLVSSLYGSPSRSGAETLALLEHVRGSLSLLDTVSSASSLS